MEVKGGRPITVTDLNTGRLLPQVALQEMHAFATVDALFDVAHDLEQISERPQQGLTQHFPDLAPWIDPCPSPQPDVQFDTTWGYPLRLHWVDGSCFSGMNLSIRVVGLRALS